MERVKYCENILLKMVKVSKVRKITRKELRDMKWIRTQMQTNIHTFVAGIFFLGGLAFLKYEFEVAVAILIFSVVYIGFIKAKSKKLTKTV
jgi:hypothetical protein